MRGFAFVAADVGKVLDDACAFETADDALRRSTAPRARRRARTRRSCRSFGDAARHGPRRVAPLSSMISPGTSAAHVLEALVQRVGTCFDAPRTRSGCVRALAVDFDLEAVQAGVIDVIGQARARAQIVEPAAADDAEATARLVRPDWQSRSQRSCVSRGIVGSSELRRACRRNRAAGHNAVLRPGAMALMTSFNISAFCERGRVCSTSATLTPTDGCGTKRPKRQNCAH